MNVGSVSFFLTCVDFFATCRLFGGGASSSLEELEELEAFDWERLREIGTVVFFTSFLYIVTWILTWISESSESSSESDVPSKKGVKFRVKKSSRKPSVNLLGAGVDFANGVPTFLRFFSPLS